MGQLILTLLGGFRARLDSGAPVALPTRKAQALLAYLAVPLGTAHPRDKLASLLWGNTLETTARTSLRQTLYAMRKSLLSIRAISSQGSSYRSSRSKTGCLATESGYTRWPSSLWPASSVTNG